MAHNDHDWDLIRQEMEADAFDKRVERSMRNAEIRQRLFLGMFPKHMRNKVIDIENNILLILIILFFVFIFILLIKSCTGQL